MNPQQVSDPPCPFGPELEYYWQMRRELFPDFDRGIQVDCVGLIGAKPQDAAERCARRLPGTIVLDGFAGIGSSAIHLARSGKRVISVELDPRRLAMAQHNAIVCEVADQIQFVRGDLRQMIQVLRVDSVYFDPPWGGMEAAERPRFGLDDYRPPAREFLEVALRFARGVALSVPPNFDFKEFERRPPDSIDPVFLDGELLYYDVFFFRPGSARSDGRPRR